MNNINLKKADQIQFFRFICFGMIFLWHAKVWQIKFLPSNIGAQTGLFFFFLLTGVVSSYSLESKDLAPTKKNIIEYVIRKIIKIYPLYFLTNLVTFLYEGGQEYVTTHNVKMFIFMVGSFIISSLMLQTWLFMPFVCNTVGWYLASMIWLSIVNIPFTNWAKSKRNQKKPILRMLGIICLAFIYLIVLSSLQFIIPFGVGAYFFQTPVFCLGFHIIGLALGQIILIVKNNYPEWALQVNKFTAIETIVLLIWLVIVFIPGEMAPLPIAMGILFDILLIFVFMLGYGKISVILRTKPLVFLGDISFECYIIHQVIIKIYSGINGWESFGFFGNAYALAICFTITIAIALYTSKIKGYPLNRNNLHISIGKTDN